MCGGEEAWTAAVSFCETVMSQKETTEWGRRPYQGCGEQHRGGQSPLGVEGRDIGEDSHRVIEEGRIEDRGKKWSKERNWRYRLRGSLAQGHSVRRQELRSEQKDLVTEKVIEIRVLSYRTFDVVGVPQYRVRCIALIEYRVPPLSGLAYRADEDIVEREEERERAKESRLECDEGGYRKAFVIFRKDVRLGPGKMVGVRYYLQQQLREEQEAVLVP
ncbi:hypothetical protein EAI_17035 [Harpegnathos saltator]|uniref:Uncharacterized protein n=1 Tax=Harpegnathos saltator TaxID=610380 RepID=E2C6A4_HARSA|nr:hypothetical protein EAI_17035 [Harpegnathos saltator]